MVGGSTGSGTDTSRNDVVHFSPFQTPTVVQEIPTEEAPPPRNGHTLVYINSTSLLLYGGTDGATTYFSTLHRLDLRKEGIAKWSLVPASGAVPTGRENHSFIALTPDTFILFGGCLGLTYSDELFLLRTAMPLSKSKMCLLQ